MKTQALLLAIALTGCASLHQQDGRLLERTASVVNIPAARLHLDERVEQSHSTYYSVSATDGRAFSCVVSGNRGVAADVGSDPQCIAKGNPLKSVGVSAN